MFTKLLQLLGLKKKPSEAPTEESIQPEASHAPQAPVESLPPKPSTATSEELCELRDGMTHEELQAHLAKLYQRHNRAASSLNPDLRAEAERMLDAIVDIRHRYLEPKEG